MKVKLVFQKSYVEMPTFDDCFATEIEVDLPQGWNQAHVIAARSYQTKKPDSQIVGGDINSTTIDYKDESHIVGRLLTYVEATYSDKEQREAQKSIVKDTLYSFFHDLRNKTVQIIDAHKVK